MQKQEEKRDAESAHLQTWSSEEMASLWATICECIHRQNCFAKSNTNMSRSWKLNCTKSFSPEQKKCYWSENFFRRAEQKCCGYWIRLTRNARNCNVRSSKVGSSHCCLDRRHLHEIATFDEIIYEYDKNIPNNWYTLQHQE